MTNRRFGGDPRALRSILDKLAPVRDEVARNASVGEGDVALDAGCGDGLIAFELLGRVGKSGKVIFLDVSRGLLDLCKAKAGEEGELARCEFVEASIEELSPISDASVDAVTVRSALIYVKRKQRALDEFFRVLKPGGRLSLFEPVNRVIANDLSRSFRGYAPEGVSDLIRKVGQIYERFQIEAGHTQMDFDDRDLFRLAEQAGFSEIRVDLRIERGPAEPLPSWETFFRTAPSPGAPTLEEAMAAALTADEAARYKAALKPEIERGRGIRLEATAFLRCVKRRV